MSSFNLVTDSRLSDAVYRSNNQTGTTVVDGWRPLRVETIADKDLSSTFGAQLYKNDATGQYKVVFRGTEANIDDWLQNLKYGTFRFSDEFRDAVVFTARAVLQVAQERGKSPSEVIELFTTTGHSQGGFLAQLISVLFNVKGTSLDGMGALAGSVALRDGRAARAVC